MKRTPKGTILIQDTVYFCKRDGEIWKSGNIGEQYYMVQSKDLSPHRL